MSSVFASPGTPSSKQCPRLNKQIKLVRQEYDAKIERLSARIKELSSGGGAAPVHAEPERKGFFRR